MSERDAAKMIIDHADASGHGGRFAGALDEMVVRRGNVILEEAWSHYDFVSPA